MSFLFLISSIEHLFCFPLLACGLFRLLGLNFHARFIPFNSVSNDITDSLALFLIS